MRSALPMRSRTPSPTGKRTKRRRRRVSGQLEFGEEERVDPLSSAWELCLHLLATKVPTVTIESYIRPILPVKLEGSIITLGVASPYARDWLEKKASNSI